MSQFPRHEDSVEAGNVLVSHFEERIRHQVVIHDETLRDGEQTVGAAFAPEVKIEIARRLLTAGIRHMSLGFPAVSEEERETIRTIVRQAGSAGVFTCLSRAREEDIRAVVACEIPETSLFVATSDVHLRHKLRMTEDEAYGRMVDQIRLARSFGLRVRFAFEDASRTPLERLKRFATGALEAGAFMVTLCDTVGVLTPLAAHRFVAAMCGVIGGEKIALHFHNDLGMATANTLSALVAGARMAQGTLAGVGERAGNTCLEELLVALRVKYGVDLGVDLAEIVRLGEHVRGLVKFARAPNQPIVGDYVFAHESGIHVNGLMRDAATYEPFPPELVGRRHEVWFGKHAGVSNVRFVAERAGLDPSEDVMTGVLHETKRRAAAGEPVTAALVLDLLKAEMRP